MPPAIPTLFFWFQVTSIESKLDSLLDVYRQVLQKGPSAVTLSSLPLFELDNQRHSSDYQTTIINRDLPSPRGGDPVGVGRRNSGSISHSLNVNTRGLRLILAPVDDDDPPDSAPPSYPPSTASLSPSPLLRPDSPYPTLVTPKISSKKPYFPDLPPPPSSSASFNLQLPTILHPSHHQCSDDPISDDQGTLDPSVVLGTHVDAGQEGDNQGSRAQEKSQLRDNAGLKSDGVWRRHFSLNVNPLLLLSSKPDASPPDWDGSVRNALSTHNLSQPLTNRAPDLSSAINNSSSSNSSERVNAHAGLRNWDEAELLISDCKLQTVEEHFSFLPEESSSRSGFLQTVEEATPHPKGNSDFLSQSHIQLA